MLSPCLEGFDESSCWNSALREHRMTPYMDRRSYCVAGFLFLYAVLSPGQPAQAQTSSPQAKPSVHWEELTGEDFIEGIKRSQGTCLLPFGFCRSMGHICR